MQFLKDGVQTSSLHWSVYTIKPNYHPPPQNDIFLYRHNRFFPNMDNPEDWEVILGEHNQYVKDVGEQTVYIEKVFIHPEWKPHETCKRNIPSGHMTSK